LPEPGFAFKQNPEERNSSVAVNSEIQQQRESQWTRGLAEPERKAVDGPPRGTGPAQGAAKGKEAQLLPVSNLRNAAHARIASCRLRGIGRGPILPE